VVRLERFGGRLENASICLEEYAKGGSPAWDGEPAPVELEKREIWITRIEVEKVGAPRRRDLKQGST